MKEEEHEGGGSEEEEKEKAPVNKNKRYRRDKPWDNEDIDHWKVDTFQNNIL